MPASRSLSSPVDDAFDYCDRNIEEKQAEHSEVGDESDHSTVSESEGDDEEETDGNEEEVEEDVQSRHPFVLEIYSLQGHHSNLDLDMLDQKSYHQLMEDGTYDSYVELTKWKKWFFTQQISYWRSKCLEYGIKLPDDQLNKGTEGSGAPLFPCMAPLLQPPVKHATIVPHPSGQVYLHSSVILDAEFKFEAISGYYDAAHIYIASVEALHNIEKVNIPSVTFKFPTGLKDGSKQAIDMALGTSGASVYHKVYRQSVLFQREFVRYRNSKKRISCEGILVFHEAFDIDTATSGVLRQFTIVDINGDDVITCVYDFVSFGTGQSTFELCGK